MELKPMYPAQKDSPSTFLLGDISAVDVLLVVGNAAIIPQTVPFPLTIGINRTITETVMVTTINLENNQLTVTRGNPAYDWPAGTTCARVFTAKNLNDLQDNVGDIGENLTTVQETVSTHNTDISALKTTVGGADSGLVKGLADEIVRAEAAEEAEVTRATGVEAGLNTAKINRTELAQVITDWVYSADGTKVLVTITRYNASTQQTTEYTRTIPVVSNATMGVMTPEAYNEIASLRNDVNALINLGGRFIGVSFATKVALNEYVVPASVKTGDFTYVIDDETKDGATTRYVRNGSVWDFTFVVNYDPVGLADDETAGLVKSTDGTVFGKIFVETDGTMSLVGWDETLNDLSSDVGDVQDEVTAHKADNTQHVTYAVTTGLANTYVVTLSPAPTAYVAGMALAVKINIDSTGASTINVNNLGAKGIKKANGTNVTNLKAGGIYTMRYDGANFILQGEGASGNATASDLLSGKTATTDAGEIIGTIPSKGAATITPGTTNQTIAAGQFLSGAQTIAGDADLIPGNIVSGKNIFGVAGTLVSASGNATASDLLSGKTATTNAGEITGTMPNRGAVSQSLAINGTYTIPEGYHNGSGQVTQSISTKAAATITPGTTNKTIAAGQYLSGAQTIAGDADLVATNIKSSVNIFGVVGNLISASDVPHGIQTYFTAGTYSFTVPDGVTGITALVVGGGGSGSGHHGYYNGAGGGGGGGIALGNLTVAPGEVIPINVGAGGEKITSTPITGKPGGDSSVKTLIGRGGKGGTSSGSSSTVGTGGAAGTSSVYGGLATNGGDGVKYVSPDGGEGGSGGNSYGAGGAGGIKGETTSYGSPGVNGGGGGGAGGYNSRRYGGEGGAGVVILFY